jgi:membrane-associated phospholipid phosphatase
MTPIVGRLSERSGAEGTQPRLARPLLTDSARSRAGVVGVCCAVLVTVLGALFAHQATADWLDHAVDSPIITVFGHHQDLAGWFAVAGSLVPAAALTAVIVVGCLLAGRLNGAVLAVAAVPVATGLNDGVFKPLVHRTYLGFLTYPSGHTATIFALAATVGVLVYPRQRARAGALRKFILVAACVLGGVVAVGVIGLKWHYFTDTVAGAAVGIGTVCGLALLLDLPAVRRPLAWASRLLPSAG